MIEVRKSVKKMLIAVAPFCCLMLATCQQPGTIDAMKPTVSLQPPTPPSVPELHVDSKGAALNVSFGGRNILINGQCYFSNPDWQNLHNVNYAQLATVHKDGVTRAELKSQAKTKEGREIGDYTLRLQWTATRLELEFEYDIKPGSPVGFAVCDLFLNRELFEPIMEAGPKRKTTGEFQSLGLARELTFDTFFGKVKWIFKEERSDSGKVQTWLFRDVRNRPWGAPELRSFSFLNSLERKPEEAVRQKITAVLEIEPSPHAAAALEADCLLRAMGKVKEREARFIVKTVDAADFAQLRESLEKLRDGKLSLQAEIDATLAQARLCLPEWIDATSGEAAQKANPPLVIPQPREITYQRGSFVVDGNTAIIVRGDADAVALRGASVLREELRDYYGFEAGIISSESLPRGKRPILVGVAGKSKLLDSICHREGIVVTAENPGAEGYVLKVTPQRIVIVGSDEAGAFYGVQTLLQLLRVDASGKSASAPCVAVRDWPLMKVRGYNFMLSGWDKAFFKRTIRRVLARNKCNQIWVGGSPGGVRWTSHPEVARKNAWDKEELRECLDYAREHFLEVIPQEQSIGHVDEILAVHPGLAEQKGYGNTFCLSNPQVKTYLTDILTEWIDLCHPRAFHLGSDEAYPIGVCEACKGHSPGELVAQHITFLHDWLAKRGIKTMMWSDMLLDRKAWPGVKANSNSGGEFSAAVHPALDLLPKDIIITYWDYDGDQVEKYAGAIRHFQDKGFPVVGCPWYDQAGNYAFARALHQEKSLGFTGTTWMYASWHNPNMLALISAEYAWSPDAPAPDRLPYIPERELQKMTLPPLPSLTAVEQTPVDLREWCNRSLRDEVAGDGRGCFDEGATYDLRFLREGRRKLEGVLFEILPASDKQAVAVAGKDIAAAGMPGAVTGIRINSPARSLVFLHGSTIVGRYSDFAKYVVNYADGTTEIIPLRETSNIMPVRKPGSYNPPFLGPMYSGYLEQVRRSWVGCNLAGEEIDLQGLEWVNPHPEKAIATVDLKVTTDNRNAAVILVALTVIP
jgi:hypothetical protein